MATTIGEKIGGLVAPPSEKMKFAIDISKWNGDIDFKKMAANDPKIDAVIIRSTEGATNLDPKFIKNVVGVASQGIKYGAYHFATWNSSNEVADATQEAKFFISALRRVAYPRYRVWLDVETNKTNIILSKKQLVKYIQTFLYILQEEGYPNYGLYSSPGFLDQFLPSDHPFGEIPLWLAHYTSKPQPRIPRGWENYELWQYTDQGIVAGIKSRTDLNRFAP